MIPVCFYEIYKMKFTIDVKKVMFVFAGAGVICMSVSLYTLLGNWHKSFDDVYAQIWIDEKGWEDTTYLFGTAVHGFEYYVRENEAYQDGYLDNATMEVDLDNLPDRFWAWRTNWNGGGWQVVIDHAKELGYDVTIYDDSGYTGQLAFCVLNEK